MRLCLVFLFTPAGCAANPGAILLRTGLGAVLEELSYEITFYERFTK